MKKCLVPVTQLEQIRSHLLSGLSISPIKALAEYRTMRLAAHIHKLKNKYGMPIKMVLRSAVNGSTYAEYSLDNGYLKNHGRSI